MKIFFIFLPEKIQVKIPSSINPPCFNEKNATFAEHCKQQSYEYT